MRFGNSIALAFVVASVLLPISSEAEASKHRRIYSVNQGIQLDGFDPGFFEGQWTANEIKNDRRRGAVRMHSYSLERTNMPQVYIFESTSSEDIHERDNFAEKKTWPSEERAYSGVIYDLLSAGVDFEELLIYNANYKQFERAPDSEKPALRRQYKRQAYDKHVAKSGSPVTVNPDLDNQYMAMYGYYEHYNRGSEGLLWINKTTIPHWPRSEYNDYSQVFDWYQERYDFDVLNETDLAFLNGNGDMLFIDIVDANFFVMYGSKGRSISGFRRILDHTKLVEIDYRADYLRWKRHKYDPK